MCCLLCALYIRWKVPVLQLDLNDAAVRNVLRTGCILLEYYQGAF